KRNPSSVSVDPCGSPLLRLSARRRRLRGGELDDPVLHRAGPRADSAQFCRRGEDVRGAPAAGTCGGGPAGFKGRSASGRLPVPLLVAANRAAHPFSVQTKAPLLRGCRMRGRVLFLRIYSGKVTQASSS